MLTTGADPLFLLDYVAANRISLDEVAELVEGAAEVCRTAGVALLGGETAELPGIYRDDKLDFAGTCVGLVDRDRLVDGSAIREGDVVVGFPPPASTRTASRSSAGCSEEEDYAGDDLLAPTRLYLDEVRALDASTAWRTSRAAGSKATWRASCPTACAPRSTGRAGSAHLSSTGSPGVEEDELRRLQPRDRLLRRRPRRAAAR